MRCVKCGKLNKESAVFCTQCGCRLELAMAEEIEKLISESKKAEETKSAQRRGAMEGRLKFRFIILLLFGILMLFCLAASLLFCAGGSGSGASAHEAYLTAEPTPEPTPSPVPTPSPLPMDMLKPTHTPPPTPSPLPMDMLKPTHVPTEEPTPEPTPEPTAEPMPPSAEWQEDCIPIDALCSYMLEGGADNIRLALPPEYLDHVIENYGFASGFLGGDDAVLEYAGKLLLTGIKLKYGKMESIRYDIVSRRTLTVSELRRLCAELVEYGMTDMPTEAHYIVIDLDLISEKGEFSERLAPHVLYIDGIWYINPDDIDI